ncbi:hypothetical protein [Pseudoalteromonas spongiae]|uniref:hypothetical protein n=1 Tax=Pseudoalteromonas spongiae TaxID=298657 RepID=UPI000C2D65B9|nr:hypothetical protein [Pseudoalteromonas spongiae]
MEIEQSKVTKLKLTKVENLDPITVFIEDIEAGKGKITIECWGKSWSAYWGGMGGRNITEFWQSSSSVDYLANCLWDHANPKTELDFDQVTKNVREKVLELRRENLVDSFFAREIYDIDQWQEFGPQHTYDDWSCPSHLDKDDFERLNLPDHSEIPEKLTSDYNYLTRIVSAVRDAFNQLSQQKAA